MATLKDLRLRIQSVTSTRKITSAMKMVAASKLRRAQAAAEQARPYAAAMERVLGAAAVSAVGSSETPRLLTGSGEENRHLVVVATSDRGLCGGFNVSITRQAIALVRALLKDGKKVQIMPIGRKGRDLLRREFASLLVEGYEGIGKKNVSFSEADEIAQRVVSSFELGEYDVCTIVYARFKSAISQIVTIQQLVPFAVQEAPEAAEKKSDELKAIYEFEPEEGDLLADLLPRNVAIQVYRALLESNASEQGARMSAMENATRNAGDMIKGLTVRYNRTRQAKITSELIEIISGAEAL